MFEQDIANREVGQLPLSIATSLAIEGSLGVHPDNPLTTKPLLEFQELWVNLRTLYRNFMGAIDKEVAAKITASPIAEALAAEMEVIRNAVADHSSMKVIFYVCEYSGMEVRYKHAQLRVDSTERQQHYKLLQDKSIQLLLDYVQDNNIGDVYLFPLKLTPKQKTKALILTHCAYDLVSYKAFEELQLLESHTGKVKPRSMWYTKYYNGKELPHIPFREDLLQVFGDSEHFKPMPIQHRREILDIAERYNWTQATKTEKIRYGVDQLKNPYLKDVLHSMISSRV